MKPAQSKNTILFGFGLIIAFFIGLATTLFLHLDQNATQLNQLVELENAQSLLLKMRQAALSRNLVLHSMMITDDPFLRDEQALEFSRLILGFVEARELFQRSAMSDARRAIWEQSQQNLANSQGTQARLIEWLRAGDTTSANRLYLDQFVPNQKENMQWMIELTNQIQNELADISQQTADSNQKTLAAMLALGLAGILAAITIAFYVAGNTSRTEKALVEAREIAVAATDSKSKFLANMSHEIRTPLTAIIGFSDSILDGQQNEAENFESVEIISRNGRHLLGIINDILDLSKIESNKLSLEITPISPLAVLRETESLVGQLARDKGLALVTEVSFPIPDAIQTDATRLKQILLNLLSNAIKFSEKGTIHLCCHFTRGVNQLHFSVTDSGIGMSPEMLSKIFQPFTQADASISRKYGGTGLGLNISKRLAELLGGEMKVESRLGSGTQFSFSIVTGPISDDGLISSHESGTHAVAARAAVIAPALRGRVLVAEDSPDIQNLVSMYLRKTGVDVTIAENGQIAVEQTMIHDFDLVFMDMQMPVMDGLQATALLRKAGYAKPIIALTANAMREDYERYRAMGISDFVAKPIAQAEFYAKLKNHLKVFEDDTKSLQEDHEYQQLAGRFTAGLPTLIEEIAQALKRENLDTVRSIAHNLKGMGGSFGYPEISKIAAEIETLAKLNRLDAIPAVYEKLTQQVRQIAA